MDLLLLTGIAILLGFAGGKIFNKIRFPAVVGYIVTGILLGPSLLNIFSIELVDRMGIISDFALGLVAFSIGNELRIGVLRKMGMGIITIILAESFGAFLVVGLGVYLLTHELYIALIFGALAVASAPAGTWIVLREYKARGSLTDTTLAVVGLDDGLAIVIYGFAAGIARVLIEHKDKLSIQNSFIWPLMESGGAIILGAVLGIILVYIMRKMRDKDDYFKLSIAGIMVCTGLSNIFHLSVILSNLFLGLVMANTFLMTSRKAVESVIKIAPTVYIIFFVLAGAHLQIGLLPKMGLLGLVYIVGRIIGKMCGARLGTTLAKSEEKVRKYLGLAILSQAGVAVGLAILVGRTFGSMGTEGKYLASLAINTIAATTIIFEIIGPITTKIAITKAGEIGKKTRRE
ncbi:cation:proton antiporter [Elusimicrobiota bacterium]